jgi:hypothetical protein
MGDDGALVPILFAMVVDEDLEVGVKTPLKKESSYVPPEAVVVLRGVLQQPVDGVLSNSSFPSDSWHYHLMEEDANVDRRWVPQTGSWEGKLFNICCLV